ncbi:MAG: uroporphyrinogen decarboxylase family protein [Anaerolineae bacterium]
MADKDLFLKAFTGEATQRPPAWEQAFASDVASELLGRPAYTGAVILHYQQAVASCNGDAAYDEFLHQLEEDQLTLARQLGWSAVSYPWLRGRPAKQIDEYTFLYGDEDADWATYRYDPVACTFGPVDYAKPLVWTGVEAIRRRVDEMWDAVDRWDVEGRPEYRALSRRWRNLAGDEFTYVAGAAGMAVPLNEQWMIACIYCPELVGDYLDAQVAVGLKQLDTMAELGLRVANGGGDLASKNGPLYGPKFFHRWVMPRYKRVIDHARSLGIYYMFRSDGDLWPIADMIFGEAGAPAFGEIDYDSGMTIPALQERFPGLTCFGNLSCPLMHDGSEAEVRAFVRDLKEKVLPRGRWILATANSTLSGTPVRNVIAMLEEGGVL